MYECRNVEMGRTKGYWDEWTKNEWTKLRKDKITQALNFEKMTGQKNERTLERKNERT